MDVNVTLKNAALVASRLDLIGDAAFKAVAATIIDSGQLLESAVKRHASGRPGPNAPTGDYRRSWSTRVRFTADTVTSITGTNRPQAARLEYGFHGMDSLGRNYNQPPFPHAGPAMDEVRPLAVVAAKTALARVARI